MYAMNYRMQTLVLNENLQRVLLSSWIRFVYESPLKTNCNSSRNIMLILHCFRSHFVSTRNVEKNLPRLNTFECRKTIGKLRVCVNQKICFFMNRLFIYKLCVFTIGVRFGIYFQNILLPPGCPNKHFSSEIKHQFCIQKHYAKQNIFIKPTHYS